GASDGPDPGETRLHRARARPGSVHSLAASSGRVARLGVMTAALTTPAAPAGPADTPSPPRSSKSSCLPVGNAANVRIYFLDVLGSGRSPTQLQATSRDASPIAEVLGGEMLAQKTCRFSAAASAAPTSVTPDDPEHCGI